VAIRFPADIPFPAERILLEPPAQAADFMEEWVVGSEDEGK
jgi:hypothetical protein